jgi:hypothetical protein
VRPTGDIDEPEPLIWVLRFDDATYVETRGLAGLGPWFPKWGAMALSHVCVCLCVWVCVCVCVLCVCAWVCHRLCGCACVGLWVLICRVFCPSVNLRVCVRVRVRERSRADIRMHIHVHKCMHPRGHVNMYVENAPAAQLISTQIVARFRSASSKSVIGPVALPAMMRLVARFAVSARQRREVRPR